MNSTLTYEQFKAEHARRQSRYFSCEFGSVEEHKACALMHDLQFQYPEYTLRLWRESNQVATKKETATVKPDESRYRQALHNLNLIDFQGKDEKTISKACFAQCKKLNLNYDRLHQIEQIQLRKYGFI